MEKKHEPRLWHFFVAPKTHSWGTCGVCDIFFDLERYVFDFFLYLSRCLSWENEQEEPLLGLFISRKTHGQKGRSETGLSSLGFNWESWRAGGGDYYHVPWLFSPGGGIQGFIFESGMVFGHFGSSNFQENMSTIVTRYLGQKTNSGMVVLFLMFLVSRTLLLLKPRNGLPVGVGRSLSVTPRGRWSQGAALSWDLTWKGKKCLGLTRFFFCCCLLVFGLAWALV